MAVYIFVAVLMLCFIHKVYCEFHPNNLLYCCSCMLFMHTYHAFPDVAITKPVYYIVQLIAVICFPFYFLNDNNVMVTFLYWVFVFSLCTV